MIFFVSIGQYLYVYILKFNFAWPVAWSADVHMLQFITDLPRHMHPNDFTRLKILIILNTSAVYNSHTWRLNTPPYTFSVTYIESYVQQFSNLGRSFTTEKEIE